MKTVHSEVLKKAEGYFIKRKYRQVISALESIDFAKVTGCEAAFGNLLFCHACLCCGLTDIKDRLQKAVEFYRLGTDNNKFAYVKYIQGRYFESIGDYISARESFTEAYVSYKRINDFAGQGRVLNRSAYISLKLGDNSGALSYLESAIKSFQSAGKKDAIGPLLNNMGAILYTTGKLKDSIKIYDSLDSSLTKRKSKIIFWYNCAIPHALIGDIKKAKELIDKSTESIDAYIRDKALYYENLGWIHLLAGEYDQALTELNKGLEISLEIAPESDLVSQIKRRIADAYFGLKQYDKAKQFADEALQVSEHLNERVEIAACWRVYGQLDAIAGKDDQAQYWFKKAIDLFAMIESRYDLAVTRYIAATSGLYHNGERQALLYIAREYFASEDVQHYVKKIDDEFQKSLQGGKPVKPPQNAPVVIAASDEMKKAVELAQIVSQADMTILLTGDTGTGKDLLAQYIHDCSGCKGPFVAVNIAGLPESMIEGELFGHRKGAFTGASHARAGLLEMAHNGTFYLNEINSTPPAIQAKLLDVLERRKIRRLGENIWRDVSFRLISATNHDLEELIRRNEFRADFYHRIKQVEISLPSLAERPDDIPALIRFFLTNTGMECDESQAQAIASRFESHLWSGNVRELKAEIEKLAILSGRNINELFDSLPTDDEYQKEQLRSLLEKYNWNRSRVAKELGLTEGTIRHRIRKFKLL